jgi:hypothetical protein
MAREELSGGDLTPFALQRATATLRDGEPEMALHWIERVPSRDRPKSLEAAIRYAVAKIAAADGEWGRCERELEVVLRLDPQAFYQRRLERVRRRSAFLEDGLWRMLQEKVDPAQHLPPDCLEPVVSSVWTCGAYHSRGHGRGMPWSRLLREAKNPPRDEDERATILKVACGFLCRYVAVKTPLVRRSDLVVAIPPDPERYSRRGISLPDHLAAAIEAQLALLWPMEALIRTKSIELRGLSRPERRQAVKGSIAARDGTLLKDRCVLLVDDVITSGATLVEAANVLRTAGAGDVCAITLCHTEG